MKIVEVTRAGISALSDRIARDSNGHAHPAPPRDAVGALLTISCDDGAEGHVVAPPGCEPGSARRVHPPGPDRRRPLRREQLWHGLYKWQRGSGGKLTDRVLCAVELALVGSRRQRCGQPVWKLLGGYRDKILAYGSTMCGDDIRRAATPEDYGRFAEWLVETRGYKAVKLHTWMPPIPGAPDVRWTTPPAPRCARPSAPTCR